jgi:hypothetical protein
MAALHLPGMRVERDWLVADQTLELCPLLDYEAIALEAARAMGKTGR